MVREPNHKLSECTILYFQFDFAVLSQNTFFFYITNMLVSIPRFVKIIPNEMERLLFYLECRCYCTITEMMLPPFICLNGTSS